MSFNKPDAQTVFEFAYTTGELYPRHVELAQKNVPLLNWINYVRFDLTSACVKEMGVQWNLLRFVKNEKKVVACAEILQSYYSEHVKEL